VFDKSAAIPIATQQKRSSPVPARRYNQSDKKNTASIPHLSGIYCIVCKATGQFYVGSAVGLQNRARGHWSALRRGKHSNKYLQRAWNRHREMNFEFRVLKLVKPSRLLATEQSWLNRTRCVDRRIGFNILPRAIAFESGRPNKKGVLRPAR
jgi:group I intron endonuclease